MKPNLRSSYQHWYSLCSLPLVRDQLATCPSQEVHDCLLHEEFTWSVLGVEEIVIENASLMPHTWSLLYQITREKSLRLVCHCCLFRHPCLLLFVYFLLRNPWSFMLQAPGLTLAEDMVSSRAYCITDNDYRGFCHCGRRRFARVWASASTAMSPGFHVYYEQKSCYWSCICVQGTGSRHFEFTSSSPPLEEIDSPTQPIEPTGKGNQAVHSYYGIASWV